MIDQATFFAGRLQEWYQKNQRKLPWRETKDPYFIWLSEIILQQTRVDQGKAYYEKFVKNYPNVSALAKSSEEQILKDWQGLGYYSRARNLHASAKFIDEELNGAFPNNYKNILKLKGVGEYTASAISSFAFNQAHAVVDGNVYRLLSRIFNIETPIDSTKGKKEFQALADALLDRENPSKYNQAIMEFGAIQCKPKNPNCQICPMQDKCLAFAKNLIQDLPVKSKKIKQRTRFFNYLIIGNSDHLLVKKREGKGIWQNLYEFILVEMQENLKAEQLIKSMAHLRNAKILDESKPVKHLLSHQIIWAKFIVLKMEQIKIPENESWKLIRHQDLGSLAVPKLIENYLEEKSNLLSLLSS